jgi:hypothetical protein
VRTTIYLPDDLYAAATEARTLNVSALCQVALRNELGRRGRGPEAARDAITDARTALDRAEAAIAEPMVTPDDVGVEMAEAYKKLCRAMSDRLDGVENGPLFATLLEVWHHVAAVCRMIDPKEGGGERAPLVEEALDERMFGGSGDGVSAG